MHLRTAPKIVLRVSTVLTLSASLVYASAFGGHYGLNTESAANQENKPNVNDRPLSRRLSALRDRIKSGDREALGSFGKEINQRGAPIVEPVPGNDRDVLVTILWRATAE